MKNDFGLSSFHYFYIREFGRSPICILSVPPHVPDPFRVVCSFVRSGVQVEECSVEDMLNFPATRFTPVIIGALCFDIQHTLGLCLGKFFKKFFLSHIGPTETFDKFA